MKQAISGIAISCVLMTAGPAQAATDKTSCARGGDARVIEVITPGNVGQSCDVRYTRGGGANVSVPYHANNSDSFCIEKATAIVNRLRGAGFTCTTSKPALRTDVSTDAASDYVVEAQRETNAETEPEAGVDSEQPLLVAATTPEPEIVAPETTYFQEGEIDETLMAEETVVASADDALEDRMSQILAQPSLGEASGGPAQLIAQRAETDSVRHASVGVGRISGVAPDAPTPAQAVTQASMAQDQTVQPTEPIRTPETEPAPVATPKVEEKKTASGSAKSLRTPRDVILATINAQAAAWNEGDLDAFMESYWKSDDLKFVSGTSITRGWSSTMKRYRDTYGGGASLGQLNFEKLDIKMITDDVAVTTGRFNLVRDAGPSSGTFTIVLRRDNGAWRIVHDHTAADE
ncbi:YybH family protein [Hyphococcus lacteus]|uniref:Nuclear transport factor 2 family protein n=1 Tax=Hyphococcus lacteus TaxID=3143536 RepID=A0ABV3YZX1_9PROT